MRIILYTGKGGVGKTSVSAATALKAAEKGYKTIVFSTDAAHSLADSFDINFNNEIQLLAPNLWGQETDMLETVKKYWGTIQEYIVALMQRWGINEILADEMAVLPGMEELANLLYIVNYYKNNDYDVIIVDCAPTGETLRLLSFPEVLRWWMEKMFPIGRTSAKLLRPLAKSLANIPIPEEKVFDSVENLYQQLCEIRSILSNPEIVSMRLVVNPEKMVIKEAQRTLTYLNLYGYFTDMVVCNRLIPDKVDDRYFDSWKVNQSNYYQMIEERFAPIPIKNIPLFDQEVVGIPMLKQMGEALFAAEDPTKFFFHNQIQEITKEDKSYILTLPLPFVTKEEISLVRNVDELIVQAGKQRRNILLPYILNGLTIEGAKYEEGRLKITFVAKSS